MIRYYLGLDASQLTKQEWADKVAFLMDIRKRESENKEINKQLDIFRSYYQ